MLNLATVMHEYVTSIDVRCCTTSTDRIRVPCTTKQITILAILVILAVVCVATHARDPALQDNSRIIEAVVEENVNGFCTFIASFTNRTN